MRQLCLEIPLRQSVAPLNAGHDIEARHRSRHALALYPGQESLIVERLAQANDGAIKLPIAVAEPAHMINERVLKACRILGRFE